MKLNELVSKYKAFIFDFDGVIVDSIEIKSEAFAQLFVDLGPEVMEKVKAYHLSHGGVSRYEKFKYYYRTFRGREITAEESADLDQQYSDLVVRKVIEADAIPGVMDFLSLIKASGKFCCVVSATPQDEIRYIVKERKLSSFFVEVLGSPRSKKENVGIIIDKNGLVAQETVYFGDAKSDYEAAKAYGVSFIGVTYSFDGELRDIEGIKKIKDFSN
ncbi:MAG: HAD family hydrolase [Candidatus Omnitrophica bacterium]|nr:HAD family hydrolase [Candidatus Omnitrophota bacterium]